MILRFLKPMHEPAHFADLRKVPIFSGLSSHQLDTLDDLLHNRSYVKDEVIFDQGEEGQAVYFVLSGAVNILKQGKTRALATLEEGQFFGERALLQDLPRLAQARAKEDCVVAVLFRDDFLSLLGTHPEIAEKISLHCSLREANQKLDTEEDTPPFMLAQNAEVPGPVTWIGIISITCLMIFLFKKLLWLIVPFILAMILYYLVSPFAKRLVLSGLNRSMAAIVISSAFLFGFGLIIILFYPYAISHLEAWQNQFYTYLSGGFALIQSILIALQHQFSFLRNAGLEQDFYMRYSEFSTQFSQGKLSSLVGSFATWLPSLLLAPIITFFLLKDGAELRKMLGNAVPNAFFEKTLYLIHALDKTARIYFTGMLKITLIDTFIIGIGLAMLGVSTPLVLGFLAAILAWIPYLGPLLGCAIAMIVASTDTPNNLSLIYSILGLFALVRILDDFVFLPLILGKSLRIHPLLTLLMFMVGEAIAGVTGLMLVIPLLAIVMVLGETMELILTDIRLIARHQHAIKQRWQMANQDLEQP